MTREEALYKANYYKEVHPNFCLDAEGFWKAVIEALEQEPCEDCISREALLTSLEEPMNWTDSEAEIQQQRDYEGFIELVKSMPSVVEHTIQSRK